MLSHSDIRDYLIRIRDYIRYILYSNPLDPSISIVVLTLKLYKLQEIALPMQITVAQQWHFHLTLYQLQIAVLFSYSISTAKDIVLLLNYTNWKEKHSFLNYIRLKRQRFFFELY